MATAEIASPPVAGRSLESPFRRTLTRFRKHHVAMLGLVVIAILVAGALAASESGAYTQDLANHELPPSLAHWFGTDSLGRDVFARTLLGGRVSLAVGLVSVIFSTVIGVVVGALAGYYRRLDFVIMRVVDVIMSFPQFVLLLLLAAFIGPGLLNIMVLIAVLTWTVPCRLIRGQFLSLREADYVVAARVIGVRDRLIVVRHILPNAIAPLLVYMSLGVASNVILEATLSFIGLGVQPPTPSWGNLLNTAHSITVLTEQPWQWVPAAILIVLFVLAVNFVGDGIRDALDARSTVERA
ncbi:MAG TPA: ABC transporter permease [Candidatus Saccharimonadales bacterium]|nr:ABC transporter permease [Candidatus Saccharimonadales bacterium]